MRIHQRQIIREAVRDRLLGSNTVAEDRVFKSRVLPYGELELPAIAVYSRTEPVDPDSKNTAPRELTRNLQLVIEGVVKLSEDVDDALDALALEIERAVDRDPTFGGAASDAILSSTDVTIEEDGDQPTGVVILTYTITYYTQAPEAEDVPLDEFRTADIRHNLGGAVHPDNEARDRVTVPTE